MAELIGQYQIGTFPTPVNGGDLDANVVRGNDNAVGTVHDSHDADPGIHLQSSLAAARPGAGSVGRKWLDNDTRRVYYDNGTAWQEIAYLPLAGGVLTGNLELPLTGRLSFGAAVGNYRLRANTGSPVALELIRVDETDYLNFRAATVYGNVSVVAPTLTGTLSTAAQPNITSVGTLTGLSASGVVGTTDSVQAGLELRCVAAATALVRLQNLTTQIGTATLTNSGNLVLDASGTSLGGIGVTVVAGSITTSATGGAATALPAQPVGYLTVTINGTARKIAYYS